MAAKIIFDKIYLLNPMEDKAPWDKNTLIYFCFAIHPDGEEIFRIPVIRLKPDDWFKLRNKFLDFYTSVDLFLGKELEIKGELTISPENKLVEFESGDVPFVSGKFIPTVLKNAIRKKLLGTARLAEINKEWAKKLYKLVKNK